MKKILTVLLCLLSAGAFAQPCEFIIEGRIEGLQVGDTLRFTKIILPDWQSEKAFDVVVTEPDAFRYEGTHEHIQQYLMSYIPADRERVVAADRAGLEIVIRDETTKLTGNWEYIYYSLLSGGVYDDAELQRIDSVRKNIEKERGYCFKMSDLAIKKGNRKEADEWSDKGGNVLNNPLFWQCQDDMEAWRARTDASEYIAFLAARGALSNPEKTRAYYDRFTPEVKDSYYGRMTWELLERMSLLELGKPAPMFTLTAESGEQITPGTAKGNYLIIYYWGMCPGSIQMDGQMQELYNRYQDKGVRVVAITNMRDAIQSFFNAIPEDDTSEKFGVPLRKTLQGMLSHPFTDIDLKKDTEGAKILDQYAINGLPFVIMLSPESTIVARGYWDAFQEIKDTLKREFPEDV